MTISIETGPHSKAPYTNWKFWEISDEALADQSVFEQEIAELREFLNEIDTGVDPHGSFEQQVEATVLKLHGFNKEHYTEKRTLSLSLAGAGAKGEFGHRIGNEPWDFEVYVKQLGLNA